MKRKVWASSPAAFVIVVAMFAMAFMSWFWNRTVFYAEISVAAVSAVTVALLNRRFHAYVSGAVKSARELLSGEQYRSLREFALPVAVVGEAGDIIWVNEAFLSRMGGKKDCLGDNIVKYIYPKTVSQVVAEGGADVSVGAKRFTVFGTATEYGSILYFIEDTYYKEISLKYAQSRPVVMLACFDNRDELVGDAGGSESGRVAAEVDSALTGWVQNLGGILKKLGNSRYLILTDEIHIRGEMEKRFPILDEVRNIKSGNRLNATVSVGVAHGASSLREADDWAGKALAMALGRGGDQVAVKQKDTYEFFGGLSKGVEKRDKVRTRVIAATLSDHIAESDVVLIMGHKYSDLDCVGAAIGMWCAAAETLKRPAYIVVNRQQSLAGPLIEAMDAEHPGKDVFLTPQEAMMLVTPRSMLIVLDTHSQEFVESSELLDSVLRIVVIDHHRMMVKHIENALVFYHETYASSTSEMVAELIQYIGDASLSPGEAEALLSGIMLDTKNFVLKTGVRTFEAAAYLRRKGADTVRVKRLFSDSIETYKAKYRIVSNAEIRGNFAVASAEKEFTDIRITSAQAADELLSIQGVNASFVLFPAGGAVNISARSLGDVNVQLIMEAMGGGGHLTMAGAQLPGMTVAEAREKLIAVIGEYTERALQS